MLSPEYIIQIQGINALPDNRRFGIFWMGYKQLATAFNMDGAFNDVSLTLMRGASEPEVIQRLDDLTAPYGAAGPTAARITSRTSTSRTRSGSCAAWG